MGGDLFPEWVFFTWVLDCYLEWLPERWICFSTSERWISFFFFYLRVASDFYWNVGGIFLC